MPPAPGWDSLCAGGEGAWTGEHKGDLHVQLWDTALPVHLPPQPAPHPPCCLPSVPVLCPELLLTVQELEQSFSRVEDRHRGDGQWRSGTCTVGGKGMGKEEERARGKIR